MSLSFTPTCARVSQARMQLAGVGGPIVAPVDGGATTSIDDLDALQIQTHPVVAVKVCYSALVVSLG